MSVPISNLANIAASAGQASSGSSGSGIGTAVMSNVLDWLNPLSWVQYFTNLSQNQKNMNFAKDQFSYQKSLNNTLMQREDNQYQRTVQDMRAAGLNPLSLTSANTNSLGGSSVSPDTDSISFPSSNMGSNLLHSIQLSNTLEDSRSKRKVESAQASNIAADARLKDVQSQLLLAELPEKSFLRDYYDSLSDEKKSELFASMYKKTSAESETPGLKNEGIKLTNENQSIQNKFLKETFEVHVASSRLEQIKLLEEIKKVSAERKYLKSSKAKQEQEIKNLKKQYDETEQAIKNMKLQAKTMDIDIDISEKTKDEYIRALNQYNWNIKNLGPTFHFGPWKSGFDYGSPKK